MRVFTPVLAIAMASAASAQPAGPGIAPRPPEEAAGQALISCVAHSMGMAPIAASNAPGLAGSGLVYSAQHPPFLQSHVQNEFGRASFASVPSNEGQVWATGYDSGVCIVTAVGTPDGPVVQRFERLFAVPGTWKQEKIKQLPGARWSQYGWKTRQANLTAQVRVTALPASSPAKGFVQVTIAPKSKAKN